VADTPHPALHIDVQVEFPGFALKVQAGMPLDGITAVFGPSGCGKSTLLRVVAGLERGAAGRLALGDEVWLGPPRREPTPTHRRGVGLVFQDARLFAHLGVEGNLRYAERRSRGGVPGTGPALAWDEVLRVLDLAPLLGRRTAQLSGGERQRVAIGRTLLARPRLLLMDEPLAALDARRKAEILPYVERLPAAFGVPILYVTHDLGEVTRLASRMLLLHEGRVRAQGAVDEVLEQADLPGVADFEAGALLRPRVTGHDREYRLLRLDLEGQSLAVPLAGEAWPAPGSEVRLRVRSRDVALAVLPPQGLSIRNVLRGTLLSLRGAPGGAQVDALVDVGGGRLRARITREAAAELRLAPGQEVFALVKSVALLDGGGAE
jgi:molybdate transport system ATP-binding protein